MINWQAIDTVLLDMDGTLLDLHYDNYFWLDYLPDHYAKLHQLEKAHCQEKLITRFLSEFGNLSFYCTDHWAKELNIEIMPLKREVSKKIQFLNGAENFLAFLEEKNKNKALVTNAHPDTLALKDDVIGINSYLDISFTSHQFGHPKEDQAFWLALEKEYSFNKNNTLFIDDNEQVLSAAKEYGIKNLVKPLAPDSEKPANNHNPSAPWIQVHSLEELIEQQ